MAAQTKRGRLTGPLPILADCVGYDSSWHYDWGGEMEMICPDSNMRLMLGWFIKGRKQPVALAILTVCPSITQVPLGSGSRERTKAIFLDLFECHEKYRGTGVAEACFKSLLDVYPDQNFMLYSVDRAFRFWKRMGFRLVSEVANEDYDLVMLLKRSDRPLDVNVQLPAWDGSSLAIDLYNEQSQNSVDLPSKNSTTSQGQQVQQGV